MHQTILITGCSTGIGFDALQTLSQRGHRVIATCRKLKDVEHLHSLGYDAILMDMDQSLSISQGFTEVLKRTNNGLDVLINNAGYGQAGALEDISREVLRAQFETNVFGLMELTRHVIPIMRAQGHGRIINMSSVLGLISMPFRGAYNASKYAVEALCDTLRLELSPSNIQVICVEPGPIESQFRNNVIDLSLKKVDMENSYFKAQYRHMLTDYRQQKSESLFTQKPAHVIHKLIHAIESSKPKIKYPVTFPTYLFILLKRVLTTKMLDRILSIISKKELNA